MTIAELQAFEKEIATLFEQGKIRCPIHLSSNNEARLIDIFKKIYSRDYVFSTHRNHLHYLLHTDDVEGLRAKILLGDSMHTCSPEHHFYSSSIVAGCVAIAAGVAYALKLKGSSQKVYCFIGDGAVDEGWFQEAVKYATTQDLPIVYIIEHNNRSVCSTVAQRWGIDFNYPTNSKIMQYNYICGYPHAGIGKFVEF